MVPPDLVALFREGSPFDEIRSTVLLKHPLPPNVEEVWLIITPQWKDGKMTQFCHSLLGGWTLQAWPVTIVSLTTFPEIPGT